jgi:CubicO group peptidase (beta-lactamase class C family)
MKAPYFREQVINPMNTTIAVKLGRILSKQARQDEFSGAVLIRQGETDLFCHAYGLANRTWMVKNRPDTRFRIASIGKMFTAVAILQLIKSGQLTLETRVLECLGLEGTKIPSATTVYHLLTMTSGIADWCNEESEHFREEWEQFCRDYPLYLFRRDADYLPVFANLAPYGPLGEKFRYNGAGFMLLGLMIEKISGQPYFDYVRQHVFVPVGMTGTDFLALDDVVSYVAEGYVPVKDENEHIIGWKKNYYFTTAGPAADGGVTSTLEDLARFARALRQGQLVSSELARAMVSPQVVEDPDNHLGFQWRYGFGCFVLLDGTGQVVRWGHTGEEDGISCRLWHYPQQEVDVVILGNLSSCAGKISREVQEMVFKL